MDYNVKFKKLTNCDLLHKCAGYTTGKESSMSLATAYKNHHSIIRSQIFVVELTDIPLFVASQLVRSHVGVQFYQRSKRTDRGGEDFRQTCDLYSAIINAQTNNIENALDDEEFDVEETAIEPALHNLRATANGLANLPNEFDRYAPTDLCFIINADALINMAHKRLCMKASKETREIMSSIVEAIQPIDPDLAKHLVPMCIYRGGLCGEPRSCQYPRTLDGYIALENYKSLFYK